jgi:phenylacetate-CoA ligase
LAEGVPPERRYPERTSGSSGEPLEFYRDRAQAIIENTSSERFFWRLWGIPFEAAIVMSTSAPPSVPTPAPWWRRLPGLRPPPLVRPFRTLAVTPAELIRQIEAWKRLGPFVIIGVASRLGWAAEEIERLGAEPPRRPVAVVTGSDTLTEPAARRIARVFGCPVHSRYATLETPYIAGTLPPSGRYAVNPLLAYVEVVDDAGGPVPPGATGRLLVTDLNNHVMPFIRYDVGDLATASPDRSAGGFPLLDRIDGRSSELLRLPSGRVISGGGIGMQLFHRHDFARWIRLFQCAQTGPNSLELRVAWVHPPADGIRSRLVEALRGIADPDTTIRVRDVEDLDRLPSGKAWIVRREDLQRVFPP